jgi:hypothetical protein
VLSSLEEVSQMPFLGQLDLQFERLLRGSSLQVQQQHSAAFGLRSMVR